MKPEDFDLLSTAVKQRSGLVLTPDKAYLLESRLMPVVRKYSLRALEDMCDLIRSKREESVLNDVTEAMTTNESYFFRDTKPFEYFRKIILPRLIAARAAKKQIRIWSTATSSGQEAYSLAMICTEESAKLQGWKIEIIGTDISHEMIERAKTGIYNQFEVQRGLPITMLIKYFDQIPSDKWQIKENIRQMVQFREGNLIQNFGPVGTFDIVFCRNVLTYFDQQTKTSVLEALSSVMASDSILVLSNMETVTGITNRFKLMGNERGLYVQSGFDVSTVKIAAG